MVKIHIADVDNLVGALKNYPGNAEEAINDVLHSDEVARLAQDAIKRFMPVSGKTWRGKAGAAKTSNSLRNTNENLSTTVRTSKAHQYLYFPDDGSTTRRHIGNQRFFAKGGEAVQGEIIERCIEKLTETFNKGE